MRRLCTRPPSDLLKLTVVFPVFCYLHRLLLPCGFYTPQCSCVFLVAELFILMFWCNLLLSPLLVLPAPLCTLSVVTVLYVMMLNLLLLPLMVLPAPLCTLSVVTVLYDAQPAVASSGACCVSTLAFSQSVLSNTDSVGVSCCCGVRPAVASCGALLASPCLLCGLSPTPCVSVFMLLW